jgi:hypothetical protein
VSRVVCVQPIRSAATIVSSSQAALIANTLVGKRPRPVALAARLRSSTRAWRDAWPGGGRVARSVCRWPRLGSAVHARGRTATVVRRRVGARGARSLRIPVASRPPQPEQQAPLLFIKIGARLGQVVCARASRRSVVEGCLASQFGSSPT